MSFSAVHYTHASATFAASFLLRLARLFPDDCNIEIVRATVERLAAQMAEIPGKRYAVTLQLMIKRSRKRRGPSASRSPKMSRDHLGHHRTDSMDYCEAAPHPQPVSPATYNSSYTINLEGGMVAQMPQGGPEHMGNFAPNVDNIWRGFEATSNEQLPVWLSDQSLGGNSFQQNGMDAFILPNDFFPPSGSQIW
jgi:hypothetical protein